MLIRPPLRNEQDGSPGGGSVPAAPAAPAASNGGSSAAPSSFPVDAIKAIVAEAVAGITPQIRDGVFAELRRAGQLKTEKATPAAPAPTQADAPASPSAPGMTAADYQQARARDRAFDRAIATAGLTDGQRDTLESLYVSVNPPDPHAWASDLIAKMGLGKSAPQQAATVQPNPTTGAAPAVNFSDKGPAAANVARDPKAILAHRPLEMTSEDLSRLKADVGEVKALEMHRDNVRAHLKSIRLTVGRQR